MLVVPVIKTTLFFFFFLPSKARMRLLLYRSFWGLEQYRHKFQNLPHLLSELTSLDYNGMEGSLQGLGTVLMSECMSFKLLLLWLSLLFMTSTLFIYCYYSSVLMSQWVDAWMDWGVYLPIHIQVHVFMYVPVYLCIYIIIPPFK